MPNYSITTWTIFSNTCPPAPHSVSLSSWSSSCRAGEQSHILIHTSSVTSHCLFWRQAPTWNSPVANAPAACVSTPSGLLSLSPFCYIYKSYKKKKKERGFGGPTFNFFKLFCCGIFSLYLRKCVCRCPIYLKESEGGKMLHQFHTIKHLMSWTHPTQ